MGMIADFPERELPVITFTIPGSKGMTCGANLSAFGQIINLRI
jgi:hypothetical protein